MLLVWCMTNLRVVLVAPNLWRIRADGLEVVVRCFAVRIDGGLPVVVHG